MEGKTPTFLGRPAAIGPGLQILELPLTPRCPLVLGWPYGYWPCSVGLVRVLWCFTGAGSGLRKRAWLHSALAMKRRCH